MLPAAFEETFSLSFVAEINITITDFQQQILRAFVEIPQELQNLTQDT